ncbi:hypothetical protein D3C77_697400 [compost metagenome]
MMPIGRLLAEIGMTSFPRLIKLGDEPIFINVVLAEYSSIRAISTVAYTSSGDLSIRIELTDLIASVSSIPDCSSCSKIFSAELLSNLALSPFPMPSLSATA